MGNDASLAALSDQPRMLYDYFKQRFAQVTNPAIDSIREEVVMSLECYIGPEANLLEVTERHAHRLRLPQPVLSNEELAALARIDARGWRARTLDATFPRGVRRSGAARGPGADRVRGHAGHRRGGQPARALGPRGGPERVPISTLLATGCVHHHLIRTHRRTRIGLVVETGEGARGASPLPADRIRGGRGQPLPRVRIPVVRRRTGLFAEHGHAQTDAGVVDAYCKGVAKGMLKVLAKMGISTLQSYKGAQIFEAVGLGPEVVQRCFSGPRAAWTHRLRGAGRGDGAPPPDRLPRPAPGGAARAANPGDFQWRSGGERHMWDPVSIGDLQVAARTDSEDAYRRFARHVDDGEHAQRHAARAVGAHPGRTAGGPRRGGAGGGDRAALRHRGHEPRLPLRGGHQTLALAMTASAASRTPAKAGRTPARFVPLPNGDSRRSRHQAGGERALRRHHRIPGQRRRAADQDRAGGESPAKAGNCRGARSMTTSPGSATRSRGSGSSARRRTTTSTRSRTSRSSSTI